MYLHRVQLRQSWCSRTPDDDGLALRPLSLPRPQCLPLPLTTIHPACTIQSIRPVQHECGARKPASDSMKRGGCGGGHVGMEGRLRRKRGEEKRGRQEGRTGGSAAQGWARPETGEASFRGIGRRMRSDPGTRREDGAAINRHGESKMSPSRGVRGCWVDFE